MSMSTVTGPRSFISSVSSNISDAVKKHDNEEVQRLINTISTEDADGTTLAILHAVDCGCRTCESYIDKLLDKGADHVVIFTYAVKRSKLDLCGRLLNLGVDVDFLDSEMLTPLMHAVKRESVETVAYLMAHKADINIQGENSRTALHIAIRTGHPAVFQKLLSAGWDQLNVDMQDSDGLTALHECAKQNNVEFARRILRIDANPEIRDWSSKRRSPLWIAIKEDKYDFVKMLLECGAEVDLDYLPPGPRDIRKLLKLHSGDVQLSATDTARRRRRKATFLGFGRLVLP